MGNVKEKATEVFKLGGQDRASLRRWQLNWVLNDKKSGLARKITGME